MMCHGFFTFSLFLIYDIKQFLENDIPMFIYKETSLRMGNSEECG